MDSRKFGQEIRHKRRALSVINQNLVGAKAYSCVVNKRGLSEYISQLLYIIYIYISSKSFAALFLLKIT